jgi:hypothetical protein
MAGASPEIIYCQMATQMYESIVATIETALAAPQLIYRSFISILKRIFSLIYASIETAIIILEQQVLSILNVDALDLLDIKANFCEVLSQCDALVNLILSPDNTILGLTDAEKLQARQSFSDFEEIVCRTSLRSLLENYTDDLLDGIQEKLNELEQQLLNQDIFQLIEEYLEELRNIGILDLFDTLDPFFNCAFALCNFAVAATRKKEEFKDLLQVEKVEGRYYLVVSGFVEDVINKENELKVRIDNLRREINSKQPERGVPIDESLS